MRQSRADNRARVIACAMTGTNPVEMWPIPMVDDVEGEAMEPTDEASAVLLLQSYFQ